MSTGLNRCGKSCRLRWTNYLRPDLKHDSFTPQEEDLIVNLHKAIGSRWVLSFIYLYMKKDVFGSTYVNFFSNNFSDTDQILLGIWHFSLYIHCLPFFSVWERGIGWGFAVKTWFLIIGPPAEFQEPFFLHF